MTWGFLGCSRAAGWAGAGRPGTRYLQLLFSVPPQGLLKASGSVPQRLALEGQCVHLVLQVARQPSGSAPCAHCPPGAPAPAAPPALQVRGPPLAPPKGHRMLEPEPPKAPVRPVLGPCPERGTNMPTDELCTEAGGGGPERAAQPRVPPGVRTLSPQPNPDRPPPREV